MYGDLHRRLARVAAVSALVLASPPQTAGAGEPPVTPAEAPAAGPSVESPIPLPANFWTLPKAERYRYLQEQLDLLDLLVQAAQKRNGIRQAGAQAAAPPLSPPGQPAAAAGIPPPPEPSLPMVLRIHFRDRTLVAEAMIPGQGLRTLRRGDEIGGAWTVGDITTDQVTVTGQDHHTLLSLPTRKPVAPPSANTPPPANVPSAPGAP